MTEGSSETSPGPSQDLRDRTWGPRTEWVPLVVFRRSSGDPLPMSCGPNFPYHLCQVPFFTALPQQGSYRWGRGPVPTSASGTERGSNTQSGCPPWGFVVLPEVPFPSPAVRTFHCNSVVPHFSPPGPGGCLLSRKGLRRRVPGRTNTSETERGS